jgi:cytochrome d ubiquinol oxidase subunit II
LSEGEGCVSEFVRIYRGYVGGCGCGAVSSLLPSSGDPAHDITIYNAATGEYALRVGLIWWGLRMCLAFGYFVFVYRMFRGKVRLEQGHQY